MSTELEIRINLSSQTNSIVPERNVLLRHYEESGFHNIGKTPLGIEDLTAFLVFITKSAMKDMTPKRRKIFLMYCMYSEPSTKIVCSTEEKTKGFRQCEVKIRLARLPSKQEDDNYSYSEKGIESPPLDETDWKALVQTIYQTILHYSNPDTLEAVRRAFKLVVHY